MKPTIIPKGIHESGTSEHMASQFADMDSKCPNGSIPIIRIQNKFRMKNFRTEDIITARLSNDTAGGKIYEAEIRLLRGEYYGSIAELNVYGLPQITKDQFSSSAIWVINDGDGLGPRDQVNSILAGWMVNPSLFGDTKTRLFTYWTADGYQKKGCFNLLCPGFVQVNREIALGNVIYPLSTYGGTQFVIKIVVFKDPNTENWWMAIGRNHEQLIGYWPKSIFCTLIGHANEIRWGGITYTSGQQKSPPMGSGHWPYEGFGKACYFNKVQLVTKGNVYKDIGEDAVRYYQSSCYGVSYFEKKKEGRFFHFGGPGGC